MPLQRKSNTSSTKDSKDTSIIKKLKHRFFKTKEVKEPDYSSLLSQYNEIKTLFFDFLQNEKKNSELNLAIEKLDILLFGIEKTFHTSKPNAAFHEFAAKCFYLRASCSLMNASQFSDRQIDDCQDGMEYMNLAIGYGLPKEEHTQTFEHYIKKLTKKTNELTQVIDSHNAKWKKNNSNNNNILLIDRSLRAEVTENSFYQSLIRYEQEGFPDLNEKIHSRAKKMMSAALNLHLILEEMHTPEFENTPPL